jgi:hypothetical protein
MELLLLPVQKEDCKTFLSNVTYSSSHRQADFPVINIQSTLRTAPDLCKNVSLAVLFGSNGNSYTVCLQLVTDICTLILYNIETMVGQKKGKLGQQ